MAKTKAKQIKRNAKRLPREREQTPTERRAFAQWAGITQHMMEAAE